MRYLIPVLLVTSLLTGCQTGPTPASSPLQSFNAGAEIAQPSDMALRTVQQWLVSSFPDTLQPIHQQDGAIWTKIRLTMPCHTMDDCAPAQHRTLHASLRIKVLPQRVAVNFSNMYWHPAPDAQSSAVTKPADKKMVEARLQSLVNSLFGQLAIP